jgi:hyperosmotically inducible protein
MNRNLAMQRAVAIALAIGVTLHPGPCLSAAEEPAMPASPEFAKLDRNHDGVLTRDEVRHIQDFARAFIEADENKDGKLDQAEFVKAEAIHDRIVAGKYLEDSLVTAKVKAALLREPELKSLDVSVETSRGEVLLAGFVKDERQREKAMQAAVAVNGVVSVKDALVVR